MATTEAPPIAVWRQPRVWLGLAVSAIFLVLLLRQVDGGELLDALRDVEVGWLVVALAVYLGALWLRALRWRLILRPHVEVAGGDAFALLVIGYAANNVLPVRAGEFVRAGLLQQRHDAPWATGLGTIVVERVLDGLVLASFLAGTVALAGGNGLLRTLAVVALLAFAGVAGLLVLLGRTEGHRARRLMPLIPSSLRPRIEATLARFAVGLTALRGGRVWGALTGLSVATWALEAATYALVGAAFGLPLDAPLYLGLCGAANLAIAAPSTAGGIGPFEYFAREVAVVYGAAVGVATAYALVLHMLILVPVVALALVLLWRHHLAPGTLLRAPAAPPTPEVPARAESA
ncbi:MAG: lysylphosphatidylglycerol synthase transmembrane domain-containing protein [Dehalococcoidia bacterium]